MDDDFCPQCGAILAMFLFRFTHFAFVKCYTCGFEGVHHPDAG